ncbi:hypothetical protein RB614_25920 [Phytohabitans sp. ZYX-F-186]|uniref:PH domain-containing protein n=1 Tax=Phytohabitans maris TaxID=3071409 RepID=A0ABU0ZNI5_9ACTN|nr:hypothetical protein [Phytohabitans sp. ZYX-F-186]MDQ7907967.1 hypothetical protein [Phytohabitans sp. ZYX-F-186]
MPPTDEEIRVAIAALRSDADEWREWVRALARASTVVDELDLSVNDMCALSGVVGLPETYGALRQRAQTLAGQGVLRFAEVADALATAADGYERDERAAVHRLRGVW